MHGIIIIINNNNNIKGIRPATTATEHKSSHLLFILIRFLVTSTLIQADPHHLHLMLLLWELKDPSLWTSSRLRRRGLGTSVLFNSPWTWVSLFSLIYIVLANKMKRVFFGSTSGQCRLESRRKTNRIPPASVVANSSTTEVEASGLCLCSSSCCVKKTTRKSVRTNERWPLYLYQ